MSSHHDLYQLDGRVEGNKGDDVYFVDDEGDKVYEGNYGGFDTVYISVPTFSDQKNAHGGVENFIITEAAREAKFSYQNYIDPLINKVNRADIDTSPIYIQGNTYDNVFDILGQTSNSGKTYMHNSKFVIQGNGGNDHYKLVFFGIGKYNLEKNEPMYILNDFEQGKDSLEIYTLGMSSTRYSPYFDKNHNTLYLDVQYDTEEVRYALIKFDLGLSNSSQFLDDLMISAL